MNLTFRILLLISCSALALSGQSLRIVGSDLTGSVLKSVLEAYAIDNNLDLEVDFGGTYEAKKRMEAGEAELAILAQPKEETIEGYRSYPLAFQVIAIVTNARSPVTELNFTQLSAMFRLGGPFDEWSSITDDSNWSSRKITLVAEDFENSLGMEIFRSIVMPQTQFNPNIQYLDESADIDKLLADNSSVIALYPTIVQNPLLKAISIRNEQAAEAYSPTRDNIYFGDYPLRLPFNLFIKEGASEGVKALAAFLYSDRASRALSFATFVTIPEEEKALITSEL